MKLHLYLRRIVPFLMAMMLATTLHASPLNDAKQAGYLGEKGDGYVGLVSNNAPSSIKQLMQEINLKRRAKYRQIAGKNGTSLRSVEGIVGQKLLDRTPRGTYMLSPSGSWVKK
ncbi:YdbL family protein [Magnetococcus sp. PR-3]|uniref:YdbL family protein n=1 Tax=Magnetococcus sp. PR-3 TaxID=3120355 RepID=UPI002FCE0269